MTQSDDKSRSQIKREFRDLKALGKELVDLSEGQVRALPLSEETRDVILATKGLTRNALQRQFRYLTSLLSHEDADVLRTALEGQLKPHADKVAALHEAEQWRDRLLDQDQKSLAEFFEDYPDCDRSQLRQLVRNALKERDLGKPPKSARQLFRYLRRWTEADRPPRS
ncbi:MAG: DUF615 domain-containing protein [Acidobacteriota bacterium]|nr:DUF615 domain-containing protein [Acidobacteriota bacterium]MDH3786486.1 DUF615 domain-containing protein [Acidobacteriota bacterium]